MTDDKVCAGCKRDNEINSAESWCSNCSELVCKICAKYHKRFSPPHEIIPMENADNLSASLLQLSLNCEIHPKDKYIMFCCQHDQLICATCVNNNHLYCKLVMHIETAAKDARDGTATDDLEKRLDTMMNIIEEMTGDCSKNSLELDRHGIEIQTKIVEIKKNIILQMDKIEARLGDNLSKHCNKGKEKIKKRKENLKAVVDQMSLLKKDLIALKQYASDVHLFQSVKIIDRKLNKQETWIRDDPSTQISINSSASEHVCTRSDDWSFGEVIYNEIKSTKPLLINKFQQGQVLLPSPEKTPKWTLVSNFTRSRLGRNTRVRSGCFLPDDYILLSDRTEHTLYKCKKDGSESQTIRIPGETIQLAVASNDKAFVTLEYDGIHEIDLTTFAIPSKLKPNGFCRSITSLHGINWVTTGLSKLLQFETDGKIIQEKAIEIKTDVICLGNYGDLYLSSLGGDEIYVMRKNKNLEVLYQSPQLKNPVGIAVDENENVYIPGNGSNNIFKINRHGQQGVVILSEVDGIDRPTGLSYYANTKELMILNEGFMSIRIYKTQ